MTLYNALPRKEYERVFKCKTAKEVWHTLTITHQGNSQVKNCKINLLTQEYEKFSISNEETIDSGFTRFNAIVTRLKSLDPDYSSKNHVRKFLRALLLKWRAKVYEMVLDNDGVESKTTKEKVKSLALKAKVTRKQTSDDSNNQGGSDEDEDEIDKLNLMARNFRRFFRKNNRFGHGNQFGNGGNRFSKGRDNSFGNKGGEMSIWMAFGGNTHDLDSVWEETDKIQLYTKFDIKRACIPPSSNTQFICTKENDGDIMFVELIKKYDDSSEEELEENDDVLTGEELGVEYFDKFPTRSELAYHKYLMCAPILSLFLRNPIIVGGSPSNFKIPCNIGHVHVGKAYIDLNSLINIMTRMHYNWSMRKQLEPRIFSKKRRKLYLQFMKMASGIIPDGVATPATVLQKENEELLKFNKGFAKTYENLLKEKRSLENERLKLFSKINELELKVKNFAKAKEVIEPCQKCVELTQKVDSLKRNVSKLQDEALNFSKFKKSSIVLDDMLSRQKSSQDKECLGFSKNEKTTFTICDDDYVVHLTKFDQKSYEGVFLGYSQTSKAYIVLNKETMRIEESLNVTFDESLPEPKSSPLVEDDRINELVVQDLNGSSSLQVNVSDEGYPKGVKEARGHPIEQVIEEEGDDDDNMIIPQTPSEEIRTRIDNTKFPPSLLKEIEEDEIWKNIKNPLSPNHIERGYSIYCENKIDTINSIKDHREENRAMFMSINDAIKLLISVATNMSCVVENEHRQGRI
ncbi:hypothetical protein Tco_1314868 [Tanacetum coccineum]